MKKFIIILSFYFVLNVNADLISNERSLKFLAVGHIYPIINDKKRLDSLLKKMNSHKADYVFILGDSKLNEIKYYDYFKKNLKGRLYFVPGNHEVKKFKDAYKKNVGYLNKVIDHDNIRFILLNSSDSKENITSFLNDKVNTDKIVLILTHHRIWDDTLMSESSYEHDKSYYFNEIYPILKNNVKAIFAGNSKRQHFRDLTDDMLTYGKQNVNLIYWLDKIGEIDLYSIGMGDGKPKANFVVVDIMDNKIFVKGDYSSIEKYDVLPNNLIAFNEQRLNMYHDTQRIKDLVKAKYYLVNKNKILIVIFIIIGVFIILILKILRNNETKN